MFDKSGSLDLTRSCPGRSGPGSISDCVDLRLHKHKVVYRMPRVALLLLLSFFYKIVYRLLQFAKLSWFYRFGCLCHEQVQCEA